MKNLFLIIIVVLVQELAFAYDPVYTKINVTIHKAGKPLSNARIISCKDFKHFGGNYEVEDCPNPIQVFSDKEGKFSITVATGYPPCTVCSCIQDKPSSCDPIMGFWFTVISGNDSRVFVLQGMGSGINETINLKCDVQPTGFKPESSYLERHYYLPELKC